MKKEEKEEKKKHPIRTFFIILLIGIIFLGLWSRFISTRGLIVHEYPLYDSTLPANFDGMKIIHFSDLHYESTVGKKELKKIVDTINSYQADVVIFTGDLFTEGINPPESTLDYLRSELQRIDARLEKYAVSGNHDYQEINYQEFMESADFKVLNNDYDLLFDNGPEPILVSGLPSSIQENHEYKKAFAPLSFTEEDEKYVGPISYKILLIHEPDNVDNIMEYHVNLVLAGHSHGGQIRAPFIGPIIKPKGAKKYPESYYKINQTELFVSNGIGTSEINFRFLSKPSINLFRIYKDTEN